MSAEVEVPRLGTHPERQLLDRDDSSTFSIYLLPETPLVKGEALPPQLILPKYGSFMREIRLKSLSAASEQRAAAQRMPRLRAEDFYPKASSEDEGISFLEASGAFYYDFTLKRIVPSEISIGTEKEAKMGIYRLRRERKLPIIEEHSHEKKLLASAPDLIPFFQTIEGESERLLKAIGISCPDFQALHVVTADTPPPMSDAEIKEYLVEWKNYSNEVIEREVAALKAHHDADPHDELAKRRYDKALYDADRRVRVERLKKLKIVTYISKDYKTFDKRDYSTLDNEDLAA